MYGVGNEAFARNSGDFGMVALGSGATVRQTGEFAVSSASGGGWSSNGLHAIDLYNETNAVVGNGRTAASGDTVDLVTANGWNASAMGTYRPGFPPSEINSMQARLVGYSNRSGASVFATELVELLVQVDDGGQLYVRGTPKVLYTASWSGSATGSGGFSDLGWSYTMSGPVATSELEIACTANPGEKAQFTARLSWVELDRNPQLN